MSQAEPYDAMRGLVGDLPPTLKFHDDAAALATFTCLYNHYSDKKLCGPLLRAMRDHIAKHEGYIWFVVRSGGEDKANPWSSKSTLKYMHNMIAYAFLKLQYSDVGDEGLIAASVARVWEERKHLYEPKSVHARSPSPSSGPDDPVSPHEPGKRALEESGGQPGAAASAERQPNKKRAKEHHRLENLEHENEQLKLQSLINLERLRELELQVQGAKDKTAGAASALGSIGSAGGGTRAEVAAPVPLYDMHDALRLRDQHIRQQQERFAMLDQCLQHMFRITTDLANVFTHLQQAVQHHQLDMMTRPELREPMVQLRTQMELLQSVAALIHHRAPVLQDFLEVSRMYQAMMAASGQGLF